MRLTFLGAAGEVTGSSFLVDAGGLRFLVDCGLFQGGRDAEAKNRDALAFDPGSIDFVLLTHAHIDHSGLLPRLAALGYRGPIYATAATADLLGVMLPDAAFIQEKEAERATAERHRRRGRGRDAAPLYTVTQANAALRLLKPVAYDAEVRPHPRVRCVFRDAGHILGSAVIEVWVDADGGHRKLVFSGDLGQRGHPIVRDPTQVENADVLVMESTYGDRLHKRMPETLDELAHAVTDTIAHKQGNVIVPAFAVGRTQDLLFLLAQLHRDERIPDVDVYVDSPLALAATQVTLKHRSLFDEEAARTLAWLLERRGQPRIHFAQEVEESIALNHIRQGAIIISASGMCEAGRIKYHLKFNLPRRECTILISGFQAEGTLGRRLVDRTKRVRIFGEEVPVKADIYTIGGLSAHADRDDLLAWLGHFRKPPRATYIVHGEAGAAAAFQATLRERLGWHAETPARNTEVRI
ncbi:MAG: MBL fold metallo-hydrolase RNA specificity domain-containing protein [Pseudomonadota bacterium]